MPDDRLSKREAAQYLRLSTRQLQRMMSARKITFTVAETSAGPMALFERTELERIKEERKHGTLRPQILTAAAPTDTPGTSGVETHVRGGALARRDAVALFEHLVAAARPAARHAALADLAHKHWLTRREAIALSGLPARVVEEALRKHKLGAKSGNRWLVKRSELERFAEKWKP